VSIGLNTFNNEDLIMKLNELAAISPTKQAAKVFESYFGGRVTLNTLTGKQAKSLLTRVRGLVREHRNTPEFHQSEQNPSYLKLVMLEQALAARVQESGATIDFNQPTGGTAQKTNPTPTGQMMGMDMAAKKKQAQEQAAAIDKQIQALQQQKQQLLQQANNPMSESRRQRRLREGSEIQTAQVVLAAQDMVDQVQKMSEQVSAMQFKDLPALVDQVKNEVGPDQAMQFNGDASAALSGLLQNLQGAKQQLESALGVVTGQAPQVPGEELGAPAPSEEEMGIDAELPTPDGEEDIDAEMDANLGTPKSALGRGRR
jgi:hypothetical protein